MNSTQLMIEETQASMRRYVPGVVQRLALTYGLLLALVVVVGTIVASGLSRFIPPSTAALAAFGVNLWLLVDVRARIEKRLQATGLFVLYTRTSRARRDFEKALDNPDLRDTYQAHAAAFIEAAQAANIDPVRQKVAD